MRLRTAAGALLLACAACATAQPTTTLSASPALTCLTPGAAERGVPAYPAELLDRKDGGTIELLNFLRNARKLPLPAYFDLDSMGCPFSVRVQYAQPHARSCVEELTTHHPARGPLMDWLSQVELNLSAAASMQVLGGELDVTVPCGKINL